jgi:hypothetical protein
MIFTNSSDSRLIYVELMYVKWCSTVIYLTILVYGCMQPHLHNQIDVCVGSVLISELSSN